MKYRILSSKEIQDVMKDINEEVLKIVYNNSKIEKDIKTLGTSDSTGFRCLLSLAYFISTERNSKNILVDNTILFLDTQNTKIALEMIRKYGISIDKELEKLWLERDVNLEGINVR